jgi:hypothetical protein
MDLMRVVANRDSRGWKGGRSFGVRQLAAAFPTASSLAGIYNRQQAGGSKSGSELPHSKGKQVFAIPQEHGKRQSANGKR